MNIAVQSPNWIGDCVMSIPALRALKYYFPASRIHLVTRSPLQDIFIHIREIDQIIPVTDRKSIRSMAAISSALRVYHFHLGILFTNSFRSALLFRLAGIKKILGYRKDLRGILLSRKLKFPRNDRHHTFFYLDLIEYMAGKDPERDRPARKYFSDELVITEGEKKSVRLLLTRHGIDTGKILIGISPSAAYGSAKEWIPERFEELIARISRKMPDAEILLFGSNRETSRVERIREKSGPRVFGLSGKFSLRESIVFISFCSLFISNDSGLMHVASGLRVPLIGIFGPTIPSKTSPMHENAKVIHHPVDCAPCQYRDCPQDHRCMKAIPVAQVYELAMNLLAGPGAVVNPVKKKGEARVIKPGP